MSTDQPVNPQAVEETKRQIRNIVNEISALTRQDVDPTIYYGEFLQRVISALAAVGGAVWTARQGAGLELAYQINLRQTFPEDEGDDRARHAKLLYKVLQTKEQMLVPPYSGAGGDDEAGNPTEYLLVLSPILDDDRAVGVVEIFQRPTSGPASQRGYLRFLVEMCQHVGDYLRGRRLQELTDWQDLFSQVDRFSRGVHESLDPRTTAYTIANEGRRLIGCDRVSVALRKGRKCVIEAVSGQDTMDTRANSVLLLGKLATAVMRSGEALWYTGDTTDLPPQIEDAIHDYVDETHTKTVAVLPLFKPSDYVPDGDEAKRLQEEKEEVVGCLIVEQIEDSRPPAEFAKGVELVSEHSARALSNAVEHNSLFLMPLWRLLGNMGWVISARTLPKTLAVLAAVLAVIAGLIFIPWDFDMKAKGKLQPQDRRFVFPGVDGKVVRVLHEEGDIVPEGEPLVELENTAIQSEIARIEGELDIARTRKKIADKQRLNPKLEESDRLRAEQEASRLAITINSLLADLAIQTKNQQELIIRSPIAGQIVKPFEVKRQLMGRSLTTANTLMVVANLGGEWALEVNMEEDNMGHIAEAMRAAPTMNVNGQVIRKLDVEYILKSDPENKLQGYLLETNIHDAAELHEEYGHSVLMVVNIEKEDITVDRLPGTEVSVRVHCGKEPVGYVLFHELIEYLQSQWLL